MYPSSIQRLIEIFANFPGVGPRTATRFALHLLKISEQERNELTENLRAVNAQVRLCVFCFQPHQPDVSASDALCDICRNAARDRSLICLVEKESDLETMERASVYRGLYFILGGTVGTLRKEELKHLRALELKERLLMPATFGIPIKQFSELILATNLTPQGEATALYITRFLERVPIHISRLARGLPLGSELEYADGETLRSALEGRK